MEGNTTRCPSCFNLKNISFGRPHLNILKILPKFHRSIEGQKVNLFRMRNSLQINRAIYIKVYNISVKVMIFYSCYAWTTFKMNIQTQKLQVLFKKYLNIFRKISWKTRTSNAHFWTLKRTLLLEMEVKDYEVGFLLLYDKPLA